MSCQCHEEGMVLNEGDWPEWEMMGDGVLQGSCGEPVGAY